MIIGTCGVGFEVDEISTIDVLFSLDASVVELPV